MGQDYTAKEHRPPDRLTRSPRVILCAILVFALVLRLVFFIGYANVDPWDDTPYLAIARIFAEGQIGKALGALSSWKGEPISPELSYLTRPGFLLPLAMMHRVVGPSELALALPSLLASIGTLLLVYRLGSNLMGQPEALLAALLFALVPLDVAYATRILPETLQAFWIAASILAAVKAAQGGPSRRRRIALYLASGVALFLGYLTRAQALLGLPIALLATARAWRRPRERWEPLLIPGALLVGLGLEALYYLAQTGTALFALSIQGAGARMLFLTHPEALFYPLPRLVVHSSYEFGSPHQLFKQLAGLMPHYPGVHLLSAFSPLGALALLYAAARLRHGLLIAWCLGFLLCVQYGFVALEWDETARKLHYYLISPNPRYLTSALAPLALLSSVFLCALGRRKKWTTALLGLAVAAAALWHIRGNHRFYRSSLEDMRRAGAFLSSEPPAPIYLDHWGAEQLRFFSRGKLRDLRNYPAGIDLPPGSLVVIGGSRGFDLASEDLAAGLPPPFAAIHLNPDVAPPHWRRIFAATGPHHVARRSDLAILRVEG